MPTTLAPEHYSKWPVLLASPQRIAAYVAELSPYEISEEQIEEQFFGCQAQLQWIALDSLCLQFEAHHERSDERQEECENRPVGSMPPLLVEGGVLQDGYHRIRTLIAQGITHHWAYVVEEAPEPSPVPKTSRFDRFFDDYPSP